MLVALVTGVIMGGSVSLARSATRATAKPTRVHGLGSDTPWS